MNGFATAAITLGALFGAANVGLFLRKWLADSHLNSDSKDSVRVAMAMVASMTALLLALLIASAKNSYDTERNEITEVAAKIIYLDRLLASYGPETDPVRHMLHESTAETIVRIWPEHASMKFDLAPGQSWSSGLARSVYKLVPADEPQRILKGQMLPLVDEIGRLRWLLFEQEDSSIATPMLVVVITWLAIIFLSIGLFAPANHTVVASLFLAALSVSGGIFLILELDMSYDGIIRISSHPMLTALNMIGS